jgi:uncharacterized protein with NRDE domain
MCTLIALVDVVPGMPLVLAANRDEFFARPARAPTSLAPGVVGGLDLRSRGSWLAIARDGRFPGVTNQREAVHEAAPRSRGEWVLELVARPDREQMRVYVHGLDATQYASGNLLFGDASGVDVAYLRRAGTVELEPLGAGRHVLANDRIGSPAFPTTDLAATKLAPLAGAPFEALRAAVPAILGDHSMPGLAALCIHLPVYGTRSATLAAIGERGTEALWWADGPPCTTPFVDAMPLYA